MKNKKVIHSIIMLFSLFFIFTSCVKQKTKWEGKIEEVDGVTVVTNPKEPMYGEDVFGLEEELPIGKVEGEEAYMFARILDIDVDEDWKIFASSAH